ncbi:MAG: phosphoadenylyl-sulfate reductase [Proteobacteria bacterium]|nr:phosphoadenylyl-sulfate reductase [Pseudomonadota bacterium]
MTASLSRLQTFYSELDAEPLLHVMTTQEFKGKIAAFSSFGSYSALLLDMVSKIDKSIPVLFLDTGKHFKETLEYVEHIRKLLGFTDLRILKPDPQLLKNSDPNGDLWNTNVNRCCWLRKVEPLERELKASGFEALITGRRRYQTDARASIESIELDEDQRYRINPFARWDKARIKEEFTKRGLPQHPLVEKGYPSIGCEPCTKAVRPGEDERSGRWAHTIDLQGKQKTECGIHIPHSVETNWTV